MLETFTKETFAAHLNTKVRVQVEEGDELELELVEATGDDFESAKERGQLRFSALFRGPRDRFLIQRIYLMEHDELGTFEIFLVPVGQNESGFTYEAAFNRMLK
jgi:hypothetical protein